MTVGEDEWKLCENAIIFEIIVTIEVAIRKWPIQLIFQIKDFDHYASDASLAIRIKGEWEQGAS